MDESIQYLPADAAVLEQVGVHTPHIRTGRRQGEGFLFCPLLLPSWFIWHTLFFSEQLHDGLRIS